MPSFSSSSSADELMKRATTTSDSFYRDNNSVEGFKDRKDRLRKERVEKKHTLSQWYGIKQRTLTRDEKQEVELLKYRNFIDQDRKHMAPKKINDADSSNFVEFGYFAGTGRNKKKRLRSFADEWLEGNPEFIDVVQKRMKKNVKLNKKSKAQAAKRAKRDAAKAKSSGKGSKRGQKKLEKITRM